MPNEILAKYPEVKTLMGEYRMREVMIT
ncbi:hypothetical protein [Shewanella livingstonensis]|uniref:Sphingolipid delta4-desaturase N-terminal domain-containing protein n=1 Tax=Shewanella livingstonensis TaxID=150120 RepID=A0A3G8LZR8_9GAMM|nr:hypothetical protein EGC82_08325 [Shewanella livingstonensis]